MIGRTSAFGPLGQKGDDMTIYSRLMAAVLLMSVSHAFGLRVIWASEKACEDAMSTAEMRECVNRRYAEVDGELNQVYRQLLSQLGSKRQELLRKAQRAWIEFRDKNAAFVASEFLDGTLYPLLEVSERTAMTERRVEDLRDHLQ
jgi:uncharacterized protein YecT (DUF1311 family)